VGVVTISALPSLDTLLMVLLGAVVGGGAVLLVWSLTPRAPKPVGGDGGADVGRLLSRLGQRGLIAIGVGLAILLLTRWVVAAVASGLLALAWPALFGGAREERRGMERLEGLAAWTESLRDTIAGAVGLEQAIPATAYAASPSVREPLMTLADRLRVRTPLPTALRRFADDLDDPSADLIVAALVLNARLRGPGLRQVLTSLSVSARAELDMRRRISASRSSTRRSVQIVCGVTVVFVLGMAVFNRGYVQAYNSLVGQIVLGVICLFFAGGFWWMRRLSVIDTPERFLRPVEQPAGAR
jgi:Flp pilus assembly protein TadB